MLNLRMDHRPTLLLLAISLAGATGARWILRTPPDQNIKTPQGLLPDTAVQLGGGRDNMASDTAALNSLFDSDQSRKIKHNANVVPQFPVSSFTDKSNMGITDHSQPESIHALLAHQGITVSGIDQNSSHVDALFGIFFEQSNTDNTRAMELIIGDWAKTQPAQAWNWIQSNDAVGVLNQFKKTILQHWLPLDADAALLAITHLENSDEKIFLLGDYAAFVTRNNPEQAFYWAYSLTEQNSRKHVLDKVLYEWASIDAEQVIQHLDNTFDTQTRQHMLLQAGPAITSNLTQSDPYQAMYWTSSLNKQENEFLSPIAFQQWVNINPQEAMQWLISHTDHQHYELYMQSAANNLAYQDLTIALDAFPNMSISVQEMMATSIAKSLYEIDPNNAQLWSNNLLDKETQRSAKRGILLASVDTEPVFALQTALEYQGLDKDKLLIDTAIEVDQQHPDVMQDWLISAPLNDIQRFDIETALIRSPAE